MRLPTRDLLATALVGAAGVLYVLWNAGFAPVGLGSVRATGLVMLGLGFVASASAVVPSFDDLMRGNKVYLAVTSIIGTGAFVAGLVVLLAASETALGVLVVTMIVLWVTATAHHVVLANHAARRGPRPGRPSAAAH